MPWDSRIESESKRRWVVAGIMLFALCMTTLGAVQLTNMRSGVYEMEQTRQEVLGHYEFELPLSMGERSGELNEFVDVKGVETEVLGMYVMGDAARMNASAMTLVEMKFERPTNLGVVHDLVRKQFEFPRTRIITSWANNTQMTGYLDGGRYREALGEGKFLATMFNYSTLTIDSKTFVCVVQTVFGEEVTELDYRRFYTVVSSLRDTRFEQVKLDGEGKVKVGELRVGKVPGSRVIRRAEGEGRENQVVFVSDGEHQPFLIEVKLLSIKVTDEGKDVGEVKLEDLAQVLERKLFPDRKPDEVNWVTGPMGKRTVAALDLSRLLGGSVFLQRVYILKLSDEYAMQVNTQAPKNLANAVAQEVVRMVGGMVYEGVRTGGVK